MTTRIEKVNNAKEQIKKNEWLNISEHRYWDIEAMENVVKQDTDTLRGVQWLYNGLRDLESEGFDVDYSGSSTPDLLVTVERDKCEVHIARCVRRYTMRTIKVEVSDLNEVRSKQREAWGQSSPAEKVLHAIVYFEDVARKNREFLAYLQEEIDE